MKPLDITVSSHIRFGKEELPNAFIDDLKEDLIVRNPAYINGLRYARGGRRFEVSPYLFCIWQDGTDYIITRGYVQRLFTLCHKHRIPFSVTKQFSSPGEADISFTGSLYGYQSDGIRAFEKRRFGILVGPLGCGKKVAALYLAAARKTPALIVVTTKRQLYMWRELVRRFLCLEDHAIGQIGDGQRRFGIVTVGIVDSLYRVMDEANEKAGFLILDRCDAAHLNIYRKIILPFKGPFMMGLATQRMRDDGLTDLMTNYLGVVIHTIALPGKFAGMGSCRPRLTIRKTNFTYLYRNDYKEMVTTLCQARERNGAIVEDILHETARTNFRALVLSDRVDHLKALHIAIEEAHGPEGAIITHETPEKSRQEVIAGFNKRATLLFTTYRSLRTLDVQGVTSLFLTVPIKNGDLVSQAVGAVVAGVQSGNEEVSRIFDYRDCNVSVLDASFFKRRKLYNSMGLIMRDLPP